MGGIEVFGGEMGGIEVGIALALSANASFGIGKAALLGGNG